MAEPVFTVTPAKKLRLSLFSERECIFCSKSFTRRSPATHAELEKLPTLLRACTGRSDKIGYMILSHQAEIYSGDVTMKYHKVCRDSYVSQHNIQHSKQTGGAFKFPHGNTSCQPGGDCSFGGGTGGGEGGGKVVAGDGDAGSYTRSKCNDTGFDWKLKCFICGLDCRDIDRNSKKNSWSMVRTLSNKSGDGNIYESVLSAATQRDDAQVITRLHGVPNGDLVAVEARYHQRKNCLVKYTDPHNIMSEKSEFKQDSDIKKLLHILIEELVTPIIIEKKVFLLSTLKQRLLELAKENNVPIDNYRTHLLKANLMQIWPELEFYQQRGKSYLVCHKDISTAEIMAKMNEIATMLQENSISELGREGTESDEEVKLSEEAIVHRAVGILRRRTKSFVHKVEGEYLSPSETTPERGLKYIEPMLYQIVCWMSDELLFTSASIPECINAKCYNIACDISTLISHIPSPKHLGLSVHLHHSYGSRGLVEDMYSLGYGVSYTEVRQFLTSAAIHVTTTSDILPSGALLPKELKNKDNGGLVIGAADNWDHNEHTVDGKRTTHAMTSIFVTVDDEMEADIGHNARIKRSSDRTLSTQSLPGGSLNNVIEYKLPSKRPEPVIIPPPTSHELNPDWTSTAVKAARDRELAYQICRHVEGSANSFPPWGPFHVSISNKNIPLSKVVYCPILMAPPTDYSTIYTTLLRNKEIADSLGQKCLPLHFDMGLLPKALEISWARPQELSGILPMEGGMHLLFALMAGIGTIYGTAGLSDLLSISGVYSAGTVQNIFRGKDFDRGLHALKMLHEVLFSQYLKAFEAWCVEKDIEAPDYDAIQCVRKKILEKWDKQDHDQDPELSVLLETLYDIVQREMDGKLKAFSEEGRQASTTFRFWDDYLQKVSLPLIMMISSSRDGNWELYQTTKEQLLPLLFASGRNTYAKYLTVQILSMKRLPNEIQEKYNSKSQFVAKLSEGNFNATWIDYVIEATENKELKGTGGIIGLTLRGSAMARWFLSRPVTAQYSAVFQDTVCAANKTKDKLPHHSLQTSEINRWNRSVKEMNGMFERGTFLNPYEVQNPPKGLAHFATGSLATAEIEKSLVTLITRGEAMVSKFLSERLIPEGNGQPAKSFHAPLSRPPLATMADMRKSVKVNKRQVSIDGEVMYLRLLAINAVKHVPLERVLSFENSPVPMSMFHLDGTMVTTDKAMFMTKLENMLTTPLPDSVTGIECIVLDGNAIIRALPVPKTCIVSTTYSGMAQLFLNHIIRLSNSVCGDSLKQIHVVFDRYFEGSIKDCTRKERSTGEGNVHVVTGDGPIPKDWTMFLNRSENKTALISLYTEHILQNAGQYLGLNQMLFTSGGNEMKAHKVTQESSTECWSLVSNQEEADGRIVLHATYASQTGCKQIVVSSPDTDVLVLLLHHHDNISANKLYFLTGRLSKYSARKRLIPVHELHVLLTESQLQLLLPVYCISGCDTVSAFHGHGKGTAFRLLMKETEMFNGMQLLGDGPELSGQAKDACQRFAIRMYGSKDTHHNLNKVRCSMAAPPQKKSKISGRKLPPTEDSFGLHIQRAAYQLMIWRSAHIGIQELPDVNDYGWRWSLESGIIEPVPMKQSCSAPELLNDLICDCNDECSTTCVCAKHKQPCVPACGCTSVSTDEHDTCKNEYSLLPITSDSEDE